jgi:hypothetical protein
MTLEETLDSGRERRARIGKMSYEKGVKGWFVRRLYDRCGYSIIYHLLNRGLHMKSGDEIYEIAIGGSVRIHEGSSGFFVFLEGQHSPDVENRRPNGFWADGKDPLEALENAKRIWAQTYHYNLNPFTYVLDEKRHK